MGLTVQGAASVFTKGVWDWEHDGGYYAIKLPSMDDDLKINAERARIVASLGGEQDFASWLYQGNLPEVVALLEVCLVKHPPQFRQITGQMVQWRAETPVDWRMVGGALVPVKFESRLNRAELQDYPELQGKPESAWSCAVREGRAFWAFFRPVDAGAGSGSGAPAGGEGPVAGDGAGLVPAGGSAPPQ